MTSCRIKMDCEQGNRECSQVRMVDAISQPGCAECGAGGLVLTDYRPYAFLQALLQQVCWGSGSARAGGALGQQGH